MSVSGLDGMYRPSIIETSVEKIEKNSSKEQVLAVSKFSKCCDEPEKIELASLYDICYYNESHHGKLDVNFYVEESEKIGNSIFEVGIGTGRIAIELLKKGKSIDGIDLSTERLMLLNNKLRELPEELQKNINVYLGDILDFKIDKKYDAVFIPFRVFQQLNDIDSQIQLLTWAKDRLNNQGKIILDVFYPDFQLLFSHVNEEKLFFSAPNCNKTYKLVEKYFLKDIINTKEQFFSITWIYKLFFNDGSEKILKEPLKLHYYTYNQLILLFKICELEVQSEFGSFDKKTSIGTGPEMIFTLIPKTNSLFLKTRGIAV